jgi:hypothetical protein
MRQSEPPILKPDVPIEPIPDEPPVIVATMTKVRPVKSAAVAATSGSSKHAR